MKKADQKSDRRKLTSLQQITNIGPSIAGDLNRIGILRPQQLIKQDPFRLYQKLCRVDGKQHDRCVIDAFMSAVDYMSGNPPKAWWHYTEQRKRRLANGAE